MSGENRELLASGTRFHGKPCPSGHTLRWVNGSKGCVICSRVRKNAVRSTPEGKAARRAYEQALRLKNYDTARRKDWLRKGASEPTRPMPEVCELCESAPDGKHKTLCLDHCHTTGKFRGWLCNNCNRALGLLKDNAELLAKAAGYLRG